MRRTESVCRVHFDSVLRSVFHLLDRLHEYHKTAVFFEKNETYVAFKNKRTARRTLEPWRIFASTFTIFSSYFVGPGVKPL